MRRFIIFIRFIQHIRLLLTLFCTPVYTWGDKRAPRAGKNRFALQHFADPPCRRYDVQSSRELTRISHPIHSLISGT
jgi:hypothetical protein